MARTRNQWKKEFMAVIESEGCVITRAEIRSGHWHVDFSHGHKRMRMTCSVSPSDNYAGNLVRQQVRRLIRESN